MPDRFRGFFRRHPILLEVLRWSVPALVIGAALRILLCTYLPYGYWGSDSKSFYSFAHMLLSDGYVSLDEKRRYLYPLLMLPVSMLPGAPPLKWLAWLQHAFGLLAVLPLAYVVRKTLTFWRWWIIPATVLYVSMPLFLWYEHELLADSLFFGLLLWAMGGWVAWVQEKDLVRAKRLFWWFFVPLAAFLLTKPSGRFVLPGIVLGIVMVKGWQRLDRRRWIALAVLLLVSLTVGSKKQAAWLLYVATFPLTQLNTPLHADYKAELRPVVTPYIEGRDAYYKRDDFPFDFLDSPSEEKGGPLWSALDNDDKKQRTVYMDLAKEGIKADPLGFVYLGAQRFVASANLSGFDEDRFKADYYAGRFAGHYRTAERQVREGKPNSIPMAFGLPKGQPLPPYEEFRRRLAAESGTWPERIVHGWSVAFEQGSDVVIMPNPPKDAPAEAFSIRHARPTILGYWVMLCLPFALFYWRTLGVWTLLALGYLAAIFLVSLVNPRYFAPAWLIFLPVLFVPLDLLLRVILQKRS
jgi:hypothetical protein